MAKYVPPTIHQEQRPDFKEKTVDSLGGGGGSAVNRPGSAPVINFRKNPASLRTREED